ncbi:guanylate kinase-associated protein [Acrasis kona]|uniref:Guanylate kinase-associated protein n=1 Tax=Acrasis kona TaxID=1008807 RepID=A0AAW2YZK4_9EUKA
MNSKILPIEIKVLEIEKRRAINKKEQLLKDLEAIRTKNASIEAIIAEETKKSEQLASAFEESKRNLIMLQYNLRKTNSKCQKLKKELNTK